MKKLFLLVAWTSIALTSCTGLEMAKEDDEYDQGRLFAIEKGTILFQDQSFITFDGFGLKLRIQDATDTLLYIATSKDVNTKWKTYRLYPSEKTYDELAETEVYQFRGSISIPEKQFIPVKVGTETVCGKPCTIFKVVFESKGKMGTVSSYQRVCLKKTIDDQVSAQADTFTETSSTADFSLDGYQKKVTFFK